MSADLTIRPRESSDIPALIQILTDVHNLTAYPVDGPPSFPARFQSPRVLESIVALCNGNLAGHAQLEDSSSLNPKVVESLTAHAPRASFAAISLLFVDPKQQGKGIGVRLVEELMAWGKKEGKRIALIVLEKDAAAIRMYKRMGFTSEFDYFYESIHGIKYKAFLFVAPE